MQACRQTQGTWPVSFVADKAYLHQVEAQERCGRVTVNIAKYASDNLMPQIPVLSFVEQLIIAVGSVSVEFPPAMSQLTLSSSSDSEEEIRERVGRLEAEMKELRKEVKGFVKHSLS